MDRRLNRPLFLAAGCLAGFVAVMLCAYFVGPVARWDATALHGLRRLAANHATLSTLAQRGAHLADPPLAIAALAVICAAGIVRGRGRQALAAALILTIAGVGAQLLQVVLAHPRHEAVLGALQLPDTAFPSGHATTAMALALATLLVVPSRWRPLAAVCAAAVTLAISIALVGDGWHYPSDVLGGYLFAGTVSLLVVAGLRATEKRSGARLARPGFGASLSPRAMATMAIGFLAVAAASAIGLLAFTHPSELASFSVANTSAVVAAVAIALASIGLVSGLTAELETR